MIQLPDLSAKFSPGGQILARAGRDTSGMVDSVSNERHHQPLALLFQTQFDDHNIVSAA